MAVCCVVHLPAVCYDTVLLPAVYCVMLPQAVCCDVVLLLAVCCMVLLLPTSGNPEQPTHLSGTGVRLWQHGHPKNISSQERAKTEVSLILSVCWAIILTTQDDCHKKKFNCWLRNFLLFLQKSVYASL